VNRGRPGDLALVSPHRTTAPRKWRLRCPNTLARPRSHAWGYDYIFEPHAIADPAGERSSMGAQRRGPTRSRLERVAVPQQVAPGRSADGPLCAEDYRLGGGGAPELSDIHWLLKHRDQRFFRPRTSAKVIAKKKSNPLRCFVPSTDHTTVCLRSIPVDLPLTRMLSRSLGADCTSRCASAARWQSTMGYEIGN